MNRIYRLVWSEKRRDCMPAAEVARAHGKRGGGGLFAARLLLALVFLLPAAVTALPTDGQVSAGSGAISQSGSTLTVTQSTPRLAVNWQGFSIGQGETVNFIQPSSSAIALNRVLGGDPSALYGRLNANGQVFLLNPNGILFGPTAQVNVGGLVASTLGLSDSDFLAGNHRFSGSGGSVVNRGSLVARDGGYIALLGGRVSNEGYIQANLGTAAVAAGNAVTLDFAGDSLLSVQVGQGTLDALAQNKQLIQADGGTVVMTAKGADAVLQSLVNNEGVIEARTAENRQGAILLLGDMANGTVRLSGALDASAPHGGDGGFVETSAAHVTVAGGAKVATDAPGGRSGTWLIDPNDYTIAASGGDISGATLSGSLGSGNVAILSSNGATAGNGDIFVNDGVSWSANTTLTLSAYRNIAVNANITASGNAAGLVLTPNTGGGGGNYSLNPGVKITLSGSSPSLTIAGTAYAVINDVNALQNMNSGLAGYYALGSDIDASATSGWNGGAGFVPVGDYDANTPFTGRLDGLGHAVDGLFINRASFTSSHLLGDGVGLFGKLGGSVDHLGLTNAAVTGHDNVGGLAGYNSGTISNSHVTGSVSHGGTDEDISRVGGLAGYNNTGAISNAYSTANVNGTSVNRVGGLVGENNGTISSAYATGNVSGNFRVGGLVGNNASGAVSNAYASGSVSGVNLVGGLVGRIDAGSVSGSYANGSVSGTTNVGGLAGSNAGTVANSYWDTDASGQGSSAGGTGLTSLQMQQQANFSGFDFNAAWILYDGHTTPLLRGFMTPLTVTANNAAKTYDGLAYSGGNGVAYSLPGATLNGTVSYGGTAQGAVNAGSYAIAPSGFWSTQHGYAISYADGALTVNKAPLTVTAANASKTYDKVAYSGGNGVGYSGFVNGETSAVLGGSLAYGGSSQGAVNAGSYAITPSGLSAANYAFNYVDGTLTVNQASLTVSTNAVTKTYDGTTGAAGSAIVAAGTLYGGDSLSGGSFAFSDKNAGTNKTVNVSGVTVSDGNGGNNYAVAYAANTASTINQAALTVSTNAVTKTYDGTTGAAGSAIVAAGTLYGGDSLSGGSFAFSDKNAGTNKTVNVSGVTVNDGNGGGNYAVAYAANTASTINKAPLTVTANNDARTYSGTAYSGGNGVAYTGLASGETGAVLSGTLSYGGTSQGAVTPGSYAITASGLSSGNYAISYADGILTLNKAPLTVTAANDSKIYDGMAYHGGNGVSYSGFVNGETSAVLGGSLAYGGSSQGAVNAGSYAITPLGLTASNYAITFIDGALSIAPSRAEDPYVAALASATGMAVGWLDGALSAPGETGSGMTTGKFAGGREVACVEGGQLSAPACAAIYGGVVFVEEGGIRLPPEE